MNKKKLAALLFSLAVLLNLFIVIFPRAIADRASNLVIEVTADQMANYQVFYSTDMNFTEEQSSKNVYITPNSNQTMKFEIPYNTNHLRIDLGDSSSNIIINNIFIEYKKKIFSVDFNKLMNSESLNMINSINVLNNELHIKTDGSDPYIIANIEDMGIINTIIEYETKIFNIKKIAICLLLDLIFVIIFKYSERVLSIPIDIFKNRKLIVYLAKNDFKTKYAGSYFGIFWAFVQPVITILLYWFVFQVGFRSSTMDKTPFVLWLIAGLMPWFFYSDALSSATNCLLEYNYLVKKVVFNISVLPMVKIGAAFFVHIFFVGFTLLIFLLYGYTPSLYNIQIIYYTICSFALLLSLSYITSSIVLFFRDLGQIINIYLQIAMWMTPIMWNYSRIPRKYLWIFQLNPMYYIVEGYRDSLINKVWFFNKLDYTFYFWIIVGITFVLSNMIFKRLKPHFADVI